MIYSLTFSRKKEYLFWPSRGLNRLTCVTRQIRGDSKLRDYTPPAEHTYSPAQRLFRRGLRSDLPGTADALKPATPPRDTVVQERISRKFPQKRARGFCRSSILDSKVKGENSRRNRVQIQQSPSTGRDRTNSTPSAPVLPDLLVRNTMTAQRSNNTPGGSQRISPTFIQPNEESTISSPSLFTRQIQLQQPHVEPFCLHFSLKSHPTHQHGLNH